MSLQEKTETNVGLLIVLSLIVVIWGGLAQIVPLFFQKSTTTPVAGLEPYAPLQLTGRDLYIREGCVGCHSQMVRPFRAETERYGHYSVAGEFIYDRPFLWGSKRTGPDLHRVGGRYSDDWHRAHLINPRDVVPESIMPGYPWLQENALDDSLIQGKMRALNLVSYKPYTEEQIAAAPAELAGKSEMDAMIAYLQSLGTKIKIRR
jgi:cytochrome c oxidase cbb3-type subunit 2